MIEEANYMSIHGTIPNRAVASDSFLCEDIHQHMIVKS